MYIRALEIRDLRSFHKGRVDLLYPRRSHADGFCEVARWPARLPNVNVFLGINGSGKSTILEAAALALLSPIIASTGFRPVSLIRRSNRGLVRRAEITARLVLHPQDGAPRKLRKEIRTKLSTIINRRGDFEFVSGTPSADASFDALFEEESWAFFFAGYGATRRTEATSASDLATRRRSRSLRYERVASLFEDHFTLLPLSAWLPAWRSRDPARYDEVLKLLKRLIPKPIRFAGQLEGDDYLFRAGRLTIPFSALSDGYRAYIGWIGDLLYRLAQSTPSSSSMRSSRGVVMIDEVDLYIHPSWQREIVPAVARAFPHIQFLFTTHSPIVVGTLERANIYNVEPGRGGMPKLSRPEEETLGLSADQILRSDAFGLESTRDPEFADAHQDLAKAAEKGDQGAALDFMRRVAIGAGDVSAEEEPPAWLRDLRFKA